MRVFMNKNFKLVALAVVLCSFLAACSTVLETQRLEGQERPVGQEDFDIKYLPLTFEAARASEKALFTRKIMVPGIGSKARLVSEGNAASISPPTTAIPSPYKLGIGDAVTFVLLNDNANFSRDLTMQSARSQEGSDGSEQTLTNSNQQSTLLTNTVTTQVARIGSDGSALYIGIGRIELAGKSISEARGLVTNALIRTGGTPNFQLEISSYNSQSVMFSTSRNSKLISITEKLLSLRELLVVSGISINESELQTVRLIRGNREYHLPVNHVFSASSPNYYLTDKDHVIVESLTYKKSTVFVVGAVATPTLVPISAEGRDTLADVLFTPGGTFATQTTRKSEIYLLRGRNPTTAWHLNAQNPARLMVAAAMELRPDDIIFVTEKPLVSFAKTMGTLLSLEAIYNNIAE
jgi:polysaccharide export outer membrane protein